MQEIWRTVQKYNIYIVNYWWEIFSVFLLSMVKFVFGAVPMAVLLGFSFFEAVTITSLGGFTGVIFFVAMSERLISGYKKREAKKYAENPGLPPRKIFTRRKRFIVSVKKRFGLLGISLLTPLLFSIPVGCFIAVRYYKEKQRILIFMFAAILFWSITVSSVKFLYH